MDNNILDDSPGSLLSKSKWYLNTYFNKLIKKNNLNVTIEQWPVLIVVLKNPGISQVEIAEKVLKDKTNITRMIDVLEKNTYVVRKKDDNDRRVYRVFLTEEGEELIKKLFPIVDSVNKECCKDLEDGELKKLKNYLKQIIETTKKLII